MRIRAKISYSAFQKNMVVIELLMKQILLSFEEIAKLKDQENDDTHDNFQLFRMNDKAF